LPFSVSHSGKGREEKGRAYLAAAEAMTAPKGRRGSSARRLLTSWGEGRRGGGARVGATALYMGGSGWVRALNGLAC